MDKSLCSGQAGWGRLGRATTTCPIVLLLGSSSYSAPLPIACVPAPTPLQMTQESLAEVVAARKSQAGGIVTLTDTVPSGGPFYWTLHHLSRMPRNPHHIYQVGNHTLAGLESLKPADVANATIRLEGSNEVCASPALHAAAIPAQCSACRFPTPAPEALSKCMPWRTHTRQRRAQQGQLQTIHAFMRAVPCSLCVTLCVCRR